MSPSMYNHCDVRRVWVSSLEERLLHFRMVDLVKSVNAWVCSAESPYLTAEVFDKSLLQINKNSSYWHLSFDIRCLKEAFHGQVISLISLEPT